MEWWTLGEIKLRTKWHSLVKTFLSLTLCWSIFTSILIITSKPINGHFLFKMLIPSRYMTLTTDLECMYFFFFKKKKLVHKFSQSFLNNRLHYPLYLIYNKSYVSDGSIWNRCMLAWKKLVFLEVIFSRWSFQVKTKASNFWGNCMCYMKA